MKKKTKRDSLVFFNYTEDGFTLLELVVSLTILTIIVVLAFGAFRLGIKAWETGDERVDFLYRMKYMVDLMEKEIGSSYPYYFRAKNEKEDRKIAFQGQPNLIKFMSSLKNNAYSVPTANRMVSFHFDEDNKLFMMTEEIIQSQGAFRNINKKKTRSIILLKDISDLKFRYYILKEHSNEGSEKGNVDDYKEDNIDNNAEYEGKWTSNFLSSKINTLPRAIEVTVAVQSQQDGINEAIEKFYLPPFIILLNAGMELRFDKAKYKEILRSAQNDKQTPRNDTSAHLSFSGSEATGESQY